MQEYRFSLTRVLPYEDRIYDSPLIQENTGQWKPVQYMCKTSLEQYSKLTLIGLYI